MFVESTERQISGHTRNSASIREQQLEDPRGRSPQTESQDQRRKRIQHKREEDGPSSVRTNAQR